MPSRDEIEAAIAAHGSKTAAAEALGLSRHALNRLLAKAFIQELAGAPPMMEIPAQGFIVKKTAVTYDKDGNLKSQTIASATAPGELYVPPAGHLIKGESVLVDPEGRVLSKWVKTKQDNQREEFFKALEQSFAKYAGTAPLAPAPDGTAAELHTVYPLADLHLGMYSWGRETGADYDVDIAVARARQAYRNLIVNTPPSRTATLLNLGDLLHANDQKNVTPGHGHTLDVDGRHPRVLEAATDLLVELVDLLLQRHEEVEIVCLPGNHDPDAAAGLRVAFRLYYRRHPRVVVNNSPGLAWYKRFGKNLIGAIHGHTIKQGDLSGMMACDRPKDWGETEFRSFFTGHIHHERAVEKAGVRAESFQTLATRDAYATNGGWRSGHSVQAITFHHDEGEISRARVNVLARPPRQDAAA